MNIKYSLSLVGIEINWLRSRRACFGSKGAGLSFNTEFLPVKPVKVCKSLEKSADLAEAIGTETLKSLKKLALCLAEAARVRIN